MGEQLPTGDFFGLDIGVTSIRLVQLKRRSANPALVTYGEIATDHPVSIDSPDDRQYITGLITQLVASSGVTTKSVVASLPTEKIFASIMTTPKMAPSELAKAVTYQAEKYIPMPLEQVRLDFAVAGPTNNPEEQEVLLIAAPTTLTTNMVGILEGAGLDVVAIETDSVALTRSVLSQGGQPVLILDIGPLYMGLTLVAGDTPRLVRSIPGGTIAFARLVAKQLGVSEEQASQLLSKFGLTQDKLEGQVFAAIKSAMDTFVNEVNQSIKYFTQRYPTTKLEKIVLTGGGSRLLELPKFLANATGLPVEIGNPWLNVAYPAGDSSFSTTTNQYAVAIGLAERGLR